MSLPETFMPLCRQVFDGPALAATWYHHARPEALQGRTPEDAVQAGDEAAVAALLDHLARGA